MATKLVSSFSSSSCFFFFILLSSTKVVLSVSPGCEAESQDACYNKHKALPLKIIAVISLMVTSMIGVALPLVTHSVPALSPDRDVFVIAKAFAAGIILATGFMHVLPDSFEMLTSGCLDDHPWHKFPFTGFLAMVSAILTLMVDSMATSFYTRRNKNGLLIPAAGVGGGGGGMGTVNGNFGSNLHCHHHGSMMAGDVEGSQLLRYRVISMVSS